jgi:hypothetical protein
MPLFLAENVGVPLLCFALLIAAGFGLAGVLNGLIRYVLIDRRVQ